MINRELARTHMFDDHTADRMANKGYWDVLL